MRRLIALVLALAAFTGLAVAAGAEPQQEDRAEAVTPAPHPDPPEVRASYWQTRGCSQGRRGPHGHPSKLARERITAIMRNHTTYTRAEGRKVRHFTYCVATKKKARAGVRHVRKLKQWRKQNVCTVRHGNRELGRCMAARDMGWTGVQFACLDELWGVRESGWDVYAHNPSSGAHGIPQALPGSKMASHGPDWWSNPFTQIAWGLDYILGRYGTPCNALAYSRSVGWY